MIDFDSFMRSLPLLVLISAVSVTVSWLVIRGAVLSALRKHSAERAERAAVD